MAQARGRTPSLLHLPPPSVLSEWTFLPKKIVGCTYFLDETGERLLKASSGSLFNLVCYARH